MGSSRGCRCRRTNYKARRKLAEGDPGGEGLDTAPIATLDDDLRNGKYAPERLAWAAHGFGGQRLIVLPESNLMLVFTGWNIDRPVLNSREMLDRVSPAVYTRNCAKPD